MVGESNPWQNRTGLDKPPHVQNSNGSDKPHHVQNRKSLYKPESVQHNNRKRAKKQETRSEEMKPELPEMMG